MENEVPLGSFRTWVKYIEKGEFPNTQRHFSVMRCNHCADAPCVAICPTKALHMRDDGIVDFDSQRCIGCKSCMAACPYDAIYLDADQHTAAKCHYCAHRVDIGLQPACVLVCPVQAIVSGDMDDPSSTISRLMGYRGKVRYDTSRPNGQPRRGLDVSRAQKILGWTARTGLEDGLRRTIDWWRSQGQKS